MRDLFLRVRLVVLLTLGLITWTASARVIDNFDDNQKTDWEDFTFVPGLGIPKETGGQFQFNLPPAGTALFVASTKKSETFTVEDGRTVEFRVDLVSGNGPDSFAVLAFIPTANEVSSLAGYGFAKSTTDILVTKSSTQFFYNENPPEPLKNENVTMVLTLTGDGPNVIINAKVLDKDSNNAVIWEETFIDTPAAEILADGTDVPSAPYRGSGNFVLLCYEDYDEDAPQASYEVAFDNAEAYVLENTLLDNFNDNTKTAWQDFTFVPGLGLPTESNGQFHFNLPPAGTPLFVASAKTSRTFDLVEGEQIRFSVDLVSGNGPDAFGVLAFIPTANELSSLAGYGFAKSTTDILITKSSTQFFYNENPPEPLKNENVRMTLTLTASKGNVIIHAQVTDLDPPNAILFEQTFIDTPAQDILADGTDNPGRPFLGTGRFVLVCYEDFDEDAPQEVYSVSFDNATAGAAPVAANTAPGIDQISPAPFANFVQNVDRLTFTVTDDQPIVEANVSVNLNGTTYTSANGLTFAGAGNTRTVTLAGIGPNTNHTAVITARDSANAETVTTVYFDTFNPNFLTIEIEDYNFNGGSFIDNPVPIAEMTGPAENAYANQFGVRGVDYNETRSNFENVPYRPDDSVRMRRSLDNIRAKFTAAGGSDAGVYDYDIGDIATGEWLNYTRTFPAGSYEVYLREGLDNGTQVETVLERVTSDPTQEQQTTSVIGSFIAPRTGFRFRNIPLTDALGQNKIVVQLSGQQTLRLRQVDGNTDNANIYQNYLVFVPVGQVVQRPIVSSLSPANNAVLDSLTPSISAEIQNRETQVQANSIKLFVNNSPVNPVITLTPTGATVAYNITPLPPSESQVTGRLEFMDNQGQSITNQWSFTLTYRSLNPAHRTTGTGAIRGMNHRFVQAVAGNPALDNTLARAENQLAANSTIPEFVDTNLFVQVINHSDNFIDRGEFPGDTLVPGLDEFFSNGDNDFAVEITAWLELSAGIHRFGVKTDDGYKLTAGPFQDPNAQILEFHNGGPGNETVDFMVAEPGLYPFRLVWYERAGSAEAEWTSVNRATGVKTLINDPDSPAAIKAFRTLLLPQITVHSATTLNGTFTVDPGATVNGNTITIPVGAGSRFFRVNAPVRYQITSSVLSGGNLTLTIAPAN